VEEAEASEIFDILMSKREEWAAVGAAGGSDFAVDLLGGKWTKAHLGVAYDAFRGSSHRGGPEQFCARFGLQKAFRCGIKDVGEELAHVICTKWSRKTQFLYDKWVAAGDAVDFSRQALDSFEENPGISRAWDAVAAGPVRERIGKIRSMMPRG